MPTRRDGWWRHVAIVGFARRLARLVQREAATDEAGTDSAADYGPPLCARYDDARVRTTFNVGFRTAALDDTDPRIVEGERINLLAFRHLASWSRQSGVRFYVVLIPNKERVFQTESAAAIAKDNPYLTTLWDLEARAHKRVTLFLAREGIAVIDTLPALQSLLATGTNPYKGHADGHPITAGYQAIARAVADRLSADGLGGP
jgi:hypothetical protein